MIKYSWKHVLALLSAILWIAGGLINSTMADSSCCAAGAAIPPSLDAGVDPNLLLMIDNSASMYDLAYVKPREEGYCYDGTYTDQASNLVESYDAASGYIGYFDATGWYAYDLAASRFVAKTATEAGTICGSADYTNSGTVCIGIDETVDPKIVTAFAATGNFLNWASASKLDIQKKILTGGKYVTVNGLGLMVMESRGCLGRRFVKKIGVSDAGGTPHYLTLGIRQPNDAEKVDDFDDTTRIEIFEVTKDGFNYDACRDALTELNSESPSLGSLKGYVEDCMGYEIGAPSVEADSMAAFNHSLLECWYYNENGEWQPGSGTVTSMKNDCEKLYDAGLLPEGIIADHLAYVCSGQYGPEDPYDGYVGRCWEPAATGEGLECVDKVCSTEPASGAPEICIGGIVHYCSGNYNALKDTCNEAWQVKQDCMGGGDLAEAGWTDDPPGADACVDQAIKDYCGFIEIPQVIDPSDAADDTGEIWNVPAVLIDTGVLAQLNEPLAVLKGHIVQTAAPDGLIEKYADEIRMGAMKFNDDGSKSECSAPDPDDPILYDCSDPVNRDGGKIISYIDQSATHTADLIAAINDIKATSWTPLAESIYNAIGYYTQDDSLRLDAADFMVDSSHDPITAWCQNNNILIITEGASTADLNTTVSGFVGTDGKNDGDTETSPCGVLSGSTYLDDLTYYAWQGTDIYGAGIPNQNIMTHIVIAGTMRAAGIGECNPEVLLNEAAANGGTSVYQANNPADLQAKLEDAFTSIREGNIFDTLPPSGTIEINSNASYCNAADVMFTLNSTDSAYMSFSNDNSSFSDWELYSTSKSWTLTEGDGTKTVYVKFMDYGCNKTTVNDSIILDTIAPSCNFVLNRGNNYTAERDVALALTSTGSDYMAFSNDGITYSAWEAYSNSKSWTLAEGDGAKTVFVRLKDEAGNIYTASSGINLDTAPPSGTFAINDGNGYSMTIDVSLTLDFDDAVQMKFSNDGISYGDWEPYADSKEWVLPIGEGVKTVYVKLKDTVGNEGTNSDTIVIDSTPPTGDMAINNAFEYSTAREVNIALTTDNAAYVCFSNDGTNYSGWESYSEFKTWSLSEGDGSKTVYVKYKDEAGNTFIVSNNIILDSTAPDAPVLNKLGVLDNNLPTLDWEIVSDADHYILEYADNPDFQNSELVDAIGPSDYELTSPLDDGTWYWRVMTVDTAGNESDWSVTGEFVIDTTAFCFYGPEKPGLLSPSNGAVDVSLTPVLNIQNPIDTPVCNYPLKTRWRISKDPNFQGLIAKVNSESKNLTSYQPSELILENNTTYYWKVRFLGSQGNNSEWSNVFSFTTQPAEGDDGDDDGIIDEQEVDDIDDLDNDGTPDNEQDIEIKSFRAKKGNLKFGLRSSNSDIVCVKALDTESVDNDGNKPGQVPYGLISYRVEVAQYGAKATIKIFLSEPASKNAKWVFYDTIDGWQDFSEHVVFNDTRTEVTVEVKDGGYGDNDHTENKIIVDPSGIGIFDDSTSDTGGGGGGCFITTIVPW